MSTSRKLIATGLMAFTFAALGAGTALADDYHDDNRVAVHVDVTATSREGNVFGYRRVTESYAFTASEYVATP